MYYGRSSPAALCHPEEKVLRFHMVVKRKKLICCLLALLPASCVSAAAGADDFSSPLALKRISSQCRREFNAKDSLADRVGRPMVRPLISFLEEFAQATELDTCIASAKSTIDDFLDKRGRKAHDSLLAEQFPIDRVLPAGEDAAGSSDLDSSLKEWFSFRFWAPVHSSSGVGSGTPLDTFQKDLCRTFFGNARGVCTEWKQHHRQRSSEASWQPSPEEEHLAQLGARYDQAFKEFDAGFQEKFVSRLPAAPCPIDYETQTEVSSEDAYQMRLGDLLPSAFELNNLCPADSRKTVVSRGVGTSPRSRGATPHPSSPTRGSSGSSADSWPNKFTLQGGGLVLLLLVVAIGAIKLLYNKRVARSSSPTPPQQEGLSSPPAAKPPGT